MTDKNIFSSTKLYKQIFSEMVLEYQKLSGISVFKTSDIYIKLKTLASQIFSLQTKLNWLEKQVFAQTATGIFLDYHAQTRGLVRKKASPSAGILTFKVSSPAQEDILIPAKTLCFSPIAPNIKFSTTSDAIIKKGETQISVSAKSLNSGLETNLSKKTISSMCNPPKFVESVINNNNFEGGYDEESDENLRIRLLSSFKNISNGCNSSYYHNIAMNYDGVLSVNVLPRNRGRGTVDLIIATTKQDPDLLNKIKTELESQKEINVDIEIREAKVKKTNIEISIETDRSVLFKNISSQTEETIKNFISKLKVYEPLKIAALGSEIFKIPGIKNYKFISPSKDLFINKDEIISLDQIKISQQ